MNDLAPWLLLALVASTPSVAADPAVAVSRIRAMTNELRTSQGVAAIAPDPRLSAAAQEFASFMARSGKYGHDADGRTPSQRAKGKGYDHCVVLENIAYQETNMVLAAEDLARIFMDGWENSPGHRKNMLDADVTQIGVGVAQAESGRYYAVQLFAQPENAMTNFEVRNRSAATIGYRVGETAYSLGPAAWRTHGVCRAVKLAVQGGEAVTPGNGDLFVLEVVRGKPGLRRN